MEMNPQGEKKKKERQTQKGLNTYLKATSEAKDNDSDRKKNYIFWTFYMYITVSTGIPKVKLINSCCEYNISIEQKSSNFIKEKKGRR